MKESEIFIRPLVVATSGHIDHGKTSLVKAITGIDTDRLQDEKKRGITIDLGFAHFEYQNGKKIAFIDVPGHEKFIHNMLAGMAGIDAVIMVVAADKGVMPQTREHLNICRLLNINEGLVVLTRVDLVEDHAMVNLCRDEVLELVEGTFLEGKPIIPVSSIKNEGIDELNFELLNFFNTIDSSQLKKPFRLNVDRSFTLKGFGTVVTGTVLSGKISKDEEINQFPQNRQLRIRGIQTHGEKAEAIYAGQRAALNLSAIKKDEIKRGDQLAKPESLITSYMLNGTFFLLEDVPEEIRNRTRIRFYIGSREVIGRIFLLDNSSLLPGEKSSVQIRLEALVSIRYGDHFIVRSFSPIITLGGGMVLDPSPRKSRRIQKEIQKRVLSLANKDTKLRSEEVIYSQSVKGVIETEFSIRSGLSGNESRKVIKHLKNKGKIFCVDDQTKRYLHVDHIDRISKYLIRILESHHKNFADRKGMTCAELSSKLKTLFNERETENILIYLVSQKKFEKTQDFYHLSSHRQIFPKFLENNLSKCIFIITSGGFQPMRKTRLLEELNLGEKEGIAILKSGVHSKRLLSVAHDLYYTPEQIDEILIILRNYLEKNQIISVIIFKELLNISRKYAVDLLEYFDRKRYTIRRDNHRIPGTILSFKN